MDKGLVFSLDALIALVIAGIITLFILTSLNQSDISYDGPLLHKSAVDILSILRESNTIETLEDESIQPFLDGLPQQICANLTVYDSDQLIEYTQVKTGCTTSQSVRSVSRRVFLSNNEIHLGELEVWYV